MVIDITQVMRSILSALRAFVAWMESIRISNGGGVGVSVFAIAVTWLVITIIIDVFVPWSGGDDDD